MLVIMYNYPMDINKFLEDSLGGVLDQDQRTAVAVFIAVSFTVWVFKNLLVLTLNRILSKGSNNFAKIFVKELHNIPVFFHLIIGTFVALSTFEIESEFRAIYKLIQLTLLLTIIYHLARVINRTIKRFSNITTRSMNDRALASAYLYLSVLMRFAIWIFGIILVLSNLGYDVTALVAGLGIGAFAIGLALKGIVQDILSSFIIIFDKPIKYGDYILVDKFYGRVNNIGIKNTRLKGTSGSEIIIPNSNIIDKTLTNFNTSEVYPINLSVVINFEEYSETTQVSNILKEALKTFKEIKADSVRTLLSELSHNEYTFDVFFLYKTVDRNLVDEHLEQIINHIFSELSKSYSVEGISFDTEVFKM